MGFCMTEASKACTFGYSKTTVRKVTLWNVSSCLKASFFLEEALCSFTYMRFQQVFKLDSQLLAGDFEEKSPNKERKH